MAENRIELNAPAIRCDGCAASIKRSLGTLAGVKNVDVDVRRKAVVVAFDDEVTGSPQIRERLSLAGFPTEPEG